MAAVVNNLHPGPQNALGQNPPEQNTAMQDKPINNKRNFYFIIWLIITCIPLIIVQFIHEPIYQESQTDLSKCPIHSNTQKCDQISLNNTRHYEKLFDTKELNDNQLTVGIRHYSLNKTELEQDLTI